jgi:ABC-type polysaccharide/polyol phosphate export permease
VSYARLGVGALAVALYALLGPGLALDRFFTSFLPIPARWPIVLAMLAGMLPYFLADEWLTRSPSAPPGFYALTKLGFVISLALAVALNLERLFFLIIILPVILVFFIVFGLFSRWAFQSTRHPWVGGLANAVVFACALGSTFPLVEG